MFCSKSQIAERISGVKLSYGVFSVELLSDIQSRGRVLSSLYLATAVYRELTSKFFIIHLLLHSLLYLSLEFILLFHQCTNHKVIFWF